jgi:hypothetical protein
MWIGAKQPALIGTSGKMCFIATQTADCVVAHTEFIGPRQGGLDRDRSKWMSEPETVISSTTSSGRSTMPSLSTIAVAK